MVKHQKVSKYYENDCSSNQSFSVCYWNLNSSISAHNYIKISLLRAYISTHKWDVICISETYLDSETSDNDDDLKNCRLQLDINYLKERMNFEI